MADILRQRNDGFRTRIETFSDGSFQEAPFGREAEIVPVVDRSGTQIDQLAWFACQPCSWWTRCLVGEFLGARALRAADWLGAPVRLYETPAGWRASQDPHGVCIIDWAADPRRLLCGAPSVFCETERLRDKLVASVWDLSRPRFNLEVGFDVPCAA